MEIQTLFQRMFDNTIIGILVVEASGVIIKSNPFLEEMFAYEEGELVGIPVESLFPGLRLFASDNPSLPKDQDPVMLASGGARFSWSAQKKSGVVFPVEASLEPALIKEKPVSIIYVFDLSEAQKKEEKLRESNREISTLISKFPGMAYRWSLGQKRYFKFVSEGSYELTGFYNHELQGASGKPFTELICPKYRKTVREEIRSAIREKRPFNLYYEFTHKNGTQRWAREQGEGIFDPEGNLIEVEGFITDETSRKVAEEKLIEAEANATILFDYSAVLIWEEDFSGVQSYLNELKKSGVKDFRTYLTNNPEEINHLASLIKITRVNKSSLDFYGQDTQEELNTNLSNWFNEESWQVFAEELIVIAEGHTEFEGEIPVITPSGELKHLYLKLTVPPKYKDTLEKVLVSFVDISKLKESEALLRKKEQQIREYSNRLEQKVAERTHELSISEAKLSEAQQWAKTGHWEWNANNDQNIWSKSIYDIFEISDDKTPIHSDQFKQFVHPDDWQALKATFDQLPVGSEKGEGLSIQYRIITKNGHIKWIYTLIKEVIRDESGNIQRVKGIIKEITENKKAEQALKQALQIEKELSEMKSRFVSMASHEFRTPLTSIQLFTDLAQMHLDRGNLKELQTHLKRIKTSIYNLTLILNDFLSLEKLESGKIDCNPEQVDLPAFITEIVEEVKLVAKKDQHINYTHSGEGPIRIDQYLIKNILLNLLSNAIKYSPDGEDVELLTDNSNGHLSIQVKDQGIGIPEKDQEHMFRRFYRASNASNIEGTGLGLTIVQRYLDLMGGSVSFESQPETGTTFHVEIPQ